MLEERGQKWGSEGMDVRTLESFGRSAPEVWIAAPLAPLSRGSFWSLFGALLLVWPYKRKGPALNRATGLLDNIPGSDLLSHRPAPAVPSAVEGLTSVFGMGTGVTLLL
jgi:hypothetical protein